MRVTVQHSGTEIPTCEGNKVAQILSGIPLPHYQVMIKVGQLKPNDLSSVETRNARRTEE
jgi:hypothetical protein